MVLSETTGNGLGPTTRYWHGLDTLAQSDGTTTQYFAYDGLGSVRQLVDASGSVGLAQTFDAYGNGYAKAGSAQSRLGYTGEQTDANGFVYLRARYYQPGMGRFTQMDPSRQERNAYLYAAGNPVALTDPSGEICIFGAYNDQIFPNWKCPDAGEGGGAGSGGSEGPLDQSSAGPTIFVSSTALLPEVATASELLNAEVVVVEGGGSLFGGAEVVVVAEEAATAPAILYYLAGLCVLLYILEDNANQQEAKGIEFIKDREGYYDRVGPYRPGDDPDDKEKRFNIAFSVTNVTTEDDDVSIMFRFCLAVIFRTGVPTSHWEMWPKWLTRLPYDPNKPTGKAYMDKEFMAAVDRNAAIALSVAAMERFYAEVKAGRHQGRIVFNLAYISKERPVTYAELEYLLSQPHLLTITTFYEQQRSGQLQNRSEADAQNVLLSG